MTTCRQKQSPHGLELLSLSFASINDKDAVHLKPVSDLADLLCSYPAQHRTDVWLRFMNIKPNVNVLVEELQRGKLTLQKQKSLLINRRYLNS